MNYNCKDAITLYFMHNSTIIYELQKKQMTLVSYYVHRISKHWNSGICHTGANYVLKHLSVYHSYNKILIF